MPSLRDILHKREGLNERTQAPTINTQNLPSSPPTPEITLLRSDTFSQEVISPPAHPDDERYLDTLATPDSPPPSPTTSRRSFQFFHRSGSMRSVSSPSPPRPRGERRLSNLLPHRGRSNSQESSANIPEGLPQIADEEGVDKQEREAQWEKRATVLVQKNPHFGQSLSSPLLSDGDLSLPGGQGRSRSSSRSRVGDPQDDVNIQEAIRLHEEGDLGRSTQMFGQLADLNGHNNPLSQVLYGLALRHGWGCTKDEVRAVTYLSAAATNSAAVESEALRAGMKKGGVAKGELVLAIFELANCFRMGWGVQKDPAAARQYYETAANLGDTDAMDQAAWCYLEGFGGKKDKFKAAKYYRLAEENGSPTVGNSWIWKEKYNPK
ncbi:uncharacterized protein N7482_008897 [Penicillium canariense]|uniref:Tetratricopeptide-like helical n=1 Tax=Penicillium canariense TaxID=189055 RepID=A0A9W9LJ69_9EURO|nr:uncharacterized protein N7482_008897 [Penicillium canariense]KAJ5157797.1 hypothetical protein N7482_008897 [Penicillium canariense]